MKNLYELMAEPTFDTNVLRRYLICQAEISYSRTFAYSFAKKIRSQYPLCFIRVLKVGTTYFVITKEHLYNLYWEARKLAYRNERRMKNETV